MTNSDWTHKSTRVETSRHEWFTLPEDNPYRCRRGKTEYQPRTFGLEFHQFGEDHPWTVAVLIRGLAIRKSDDTPGVQDVRDQLPGTHTRAHIAAGLAPEMPKPVLEAIAAYWPDNPAPAPEPDPVGD